MRSGRSIVWYSGRLLMSDDLSRGGSIRVEQSSRAKAEGAAYDDSAYVRVLVGILAS